MEIFEKCNEINDLLIANKENAARNILIQLLDFHELNKIEYSPLVNHLIRETGLYPYLQLENSDWEDRFVSEMFKVPTSYKQINTLHREQSLLLSKLLEGKNIAVSAPTSFGKSFVIDAFISIKKPRNIVIIVPTIALTDETRRRLYRKFAHEYKIITTTEVELAEKNIFIFPQERAINYVDKLKLIDVLIVDEFYKASTNFDSERAPSLLRAILKLGKQAKQKYFLAPNISVLEENPFTKDFEFLKLDFNTVYLETFALYNEIKNNEKLKNQKLLEILTQKKTKTLIYAGTYANIKRVSNLLMENKQNIESEILASFSNWLSENYEINWELTILSKKGVGIHNGQLHRSLSQIQVKLFENQNGLSELISTSSIIEGVNTSAENVIIWANKSGKGRARLNDFTYKNIMGRSGRMFRHFIGKVYILDTPPEQEEIQLGIPFPDEILGDLNEVKYKDDLTQQQVAKIVSYRKEIQDLLGIASYDTLFEHNLFQTSDLDLIKTIAIDMKTKPDDWSGLGFLNSPNVKSWDRLLYKIINLKPGYWDALHSKFVEFIKILSQNWIKSIPELLKDLEPHDIGIDDFFKLERNVSFKFASLLNDVNLLQKEILPHKKYDISGFISLISNAFLPKVVFQLEEFGMPRMISKKIQNSGLIDFHNNELTIHKTIEILNNLGFDKFKEQTKISDFEIFITKYFYEGISIE